MKTKALYTGSFDPLTNGHYNIIERASKLYDDLTVGIIMNPAKKSLFSLQERKEMIEETMKPLGNVRVDSFSGLLADYVNKNGFNVVVRGLRSSMDFEYEIQMAQMNARLFNEAVETVFLMTDPQSSFISSSMVKEVHSLGGSIEGLVPDEILRSMKALTEDRRMVMRVLELLEEIEEIVDTAAGFPLTGKIMVDSQELLEIVREIRAELPDEIQQAQWIKNERERIIAEAKTQYEAVIDDAQKQADALVENNDITVRAKMRADELMQVTESTAKQLKIGTYDYLDSILYSFQGKMEHLSSIYFGEMFTSIEKAFDDINSALAANREELKDMSYRTQINAEEMPEPSSAPGAEQAPREEE